MHQKGYGLIRIDGVMCRVHRLVCIRRHGPPPTDDLEAAHSCGNAGCVNPRHIRWATRFENAADKKLHGTDSMSTYLKAKALAS